MLHNNNTTWNIECQEQFDLIRLLLGNCSGEATDEIVKNVHDPSHPELS